MNEEEYGRPAYDSVQALEQTLLEDVVLTREWIRDLAVKIKKRKRLARKQAERLRREVARLEIAYDPVSHFSPGYNASADRMRGELRFQLSIARGEEVRGETDCWKDTLPLERELRILVQAYPRAKWRKEMIG